MNFYVAGKWQQRVWIREIMDQIESLGHSIAVDWPNYESKASFDHKYLERCAKVDIDGVKACDILIATLFNRLRAGTIATTKDSFLL